MQSPELERRIAELVIERARLLAPALFVTFLFYVLAAGPLGTRAPGWGHVYGVIALIGIGVVASLFVLRRIPDRWCHLASASLLWLATSSTLVTLWTTSSTTVLLLLLIEIAAAGFLLDTRLAVATLLVAIGVAAPQVVDIDGVTPVAAIAALVTDASFALLIHVLVKGAILSAETARLAEVETARRLATELRETAKLQDQLLHAQRMEAVGTLAAGVAHDMNNVLASITNFANLQLETSDGNASRDLVHILEQAKRGAGLTRGLLAFSRRGQYRKQVVRCDDVIRDVLPLLARTLPKSIEVNERIDLGDACVDADSVHLGQMLVNFALNAADAMDGTGKIEIEADVVDHGTPARPHMRLTVTDTGRGMDAATCRRVFEPFFTTKPLGKGSGLGLSIVWGIVQAHDGTVSVRSAPGSGTTFTVHLPLTAALPTRASVRASQPPAVERSTVLVVDDELAVRESTRRLLVRMGLDVVVASHGQEGLAMFATHASTIRVVILDMGMPVMGGAECFRRIRALKPVPVVIATGYAVEEELEQLEAAGATILEKPFASTELRRVVTRLLGQERPLRAIAAS